MTNFCSKLHKNAVQDVFALFIVVFALFSNAETEIPGKHSSKEKCTKKFIELCIIRQLQTPLKMAIITTVIKRKAVDNYDQQRGKVP